MKQNEDRERRKPLGLQPMCPEVSSQEKGGNLRAEGRKLCGRTDTGRKNKKKPKIVVQLNALLLFYVLVVWPPGMWALAPWPGMEPTPPPMQALEGGGFFYYSNFIPVLSVFAFGSAGCPLLFPSCGEGLGGAGLTSGCGSLGFSGQWLLWLQSTGSRVLVLSIGSSQALERRLSRRGA